MNPNMKIFISGLLTFVITAGGAIMAVMVDMAPEDPISAKVWLTAGIVGMIAAAKDWKTFTAAPPSTGGGL